LDDQNSSVFKVTGYELDDWGLISASPSRLAWYLSTRLTALLLFVVSYLHIPHIVLSYGVRL
jgi:hypothetical protein